MAEQARMQREALRNPQLELIPREALRNPSPADPVRIQPRASSSLAPSSLPPLATMRKKTKMTTRVRRGSSNPTWARFPSSSIATSLTITTTIPSPPVAFRSTERGPAPYRVLPDGVLLCVSPRSTLSCLLRPMSAAASSSSPLCSFCPPVDTAVYGQSMLKLLDVLVQLDHLKNAKASIPNDFSWYKRTFTQVSVQWQDTDSMREELDDLQSDPVIPAFPDLHLSPAAIMKELSMYFQSFSSQTRLLTLPGPHEIPPRELQEYPIHIYFPACTKDLERKNTEKRKEEVAIEEEDEEEEGEGERRRKKRRRWRNRRKEEEEERHYLIVNHIGTIRAEHDDFSIRFVSALNQIVILKSTDGADTEWSREVKGNMYDLVVEGCQLLSRWTGRIWEQCAWKFSRPCKEPASVGSHQSSTTFFDYEKVVRWNYTADERKALLELVGYIKSIGLMMEHCDTLVADALWETIHAEVQDFVQDRLDTMLRTTFRKKKDLSRLLSDMRTLSADWMANTSKAEPELHSLHQENEETKQSAFYPRPVAPTAAQVVAGLALVGD
ncbi:Cytoplasmic Fragile-X interacting family [Musa troglodytarum]|uniref:Cytoplasmic Fragile-X interacting family n=1 Tax=Musa troglodytarum TaxID=320322 RepID=A0A9E7JWG3_9LILI|nr:Cytoplasmic Fragile-X interacting family [Musa troglodytarum]